MVMGGADVAGTELLIGNASQQMVMKCDDDMQFTLAAPESGAMTAAGEPYPEGSMTMTPAQ